MIPGSGEASVPNTTNLNAQEKPDDKILFQRAIGQKKSLKEPLLLSPNSNDCDYNSNFEFMKYQVGHLSMNNNQEQYFPNVS